MQIIMVEKLYWLLIKQNEQADMQTLTGHNQSSRLFTGSKFVGQLMAGLTSIGAGVSE